MKFKLCSPIEYAIIRVGQPIERTPTLDQIFEACAHVYGIYRYQIKGKSRETKLVEARYAAIAMLKRLYPLYTLSEVGKIFGKRDHSTIIYARRKFEDMMITDWTYRTKFDLFINALAPKKANG